MRSPAGLHVAERPAATPGGPAVVLVHGSLDRGESFRRVMRRLPEATVVAYDRRGYHLSRPAGVTDIAGHIGDLLDVVAALRAAGAGPVAAVGHSVGGDVVLGAALAEPRALPSIGAFEPPMPWLGFRRRQGADGAGSPWTPMDEDPGAEAERFFTRMVGPGAWNRLSEQGRAERRADGPALVADLLSVRGEAPFDVMDLSVPVVFGMGGAASQPHHRNGVTWLGSHVPGASIYEIPGAGHGAHLSHPDGFATYVRTVLAALP